MTKEERDEILSRKIPDSEVAKHIEEINAPLPEPIPIQEQLRNQSIAFSKWKDKLTPAEKCTVWPPGGDGMIGLYNMADNDLYDKFLDHQKKFTQQTEKQ
jgi:hypothetical protein